MPIINKLPKKKRSETSGNGKREQRKKFYDTQKWRKFRRSFLASHSLCKDCLDGISEHENNVESKIKMAEDVHHLISFMSTDNPVEQAALFYDENNLVALCKFHHQLRHNPIKHN